MRNTMLAFSLLVTIFTANVSLASPCEDLIGAEENPAANKMFKTRGEFFRAFAADLKSAKQSGDLVWIYSYLGLMDVAMVVPVMQLLGIFIDDVTDTELSDGTLEITINGRYPGNDKIYNFRFVEARQGSMYYRLAKPVATFKRETKRSFFLNRVIKDKLITQADLQPYETPFYPPYQDNNFLAVVMTWRGIRFGTLRSSSDFSIRLSDYPQDSTAEGFAFDGIHRVDIFEYTTGLRANPRNVMN